VLEAAKGQTVDWYMYGGDDRLNGYVNGYVKDRLAELDITLNQVKINDTAEAVNKVLGEKTAGKDEDGSVDLIWINGENFATLKQADAVRCGYVDMLPSAQYVDLEGPGIATDFGTPTEGCEVPWQQATSSLVYDSTALTEEDTASVESLFAWAEANPGRFTYAAPPDFTGSMAVRTFFFDAAGGPGRLPRGLRRAGLRGSGSQLWERLNALEPALWREGSTYPATRARCRRCSPATRSTPTSPTARARSAGWSRRASCRRPRAAPSSTPATSATTASRRSPTTPGTPRPRWCSPTCCCRPRRRSSNAGPEGAGFTSAIDLSRLPQEQAAEFERLQQSPYQVPPADLAAATLPEVSAEYVNQLEKDWKANVLQQ
jgi:putative spermidine/putrescine transport system substrate-binding protein